LKTSKPLPALDPVAGQEPPPAAAVSAMFESEERGILD
jgi:hypothetical protein